MRRGRWAKSAEGAGEAAPPPPTDEGTEMSTVVEESPQPSSGTGIRRRAGRWGAGGAAEGTEGGEEDKVGHKVDFRFGEEEGTIRHEESEGVSEEEGEEEAEEEIDCPYCNHVQKVRMGTDLTTVIECSKCGRKKALRAWVWRTYPQVPLHEDPPRVYHTPHYCHIASVATNSVTLQPRKPVVHTELQSDPTSWPLEEVVCPFGDGPVDCWSNTHALQDTDSETQWMWYARPSAPMLLAKSLLASSKSLLSRTRRWRAPPVPPASADDTQNFLPEVQGVDMALGGGLLDDVFQNQTQLAKVQLHKGPHIQVKGARRGSTERRGSAGSNAEEVGVSQVAERISTLRSAVLEGYLTLSRSLEVEASALLAPERRGGAGLPSCIPLEYYLKGADGVHAPREPSAAKHLSGPLEQRLMPALIAGPLDPAAVRARAAKYLDPETGLLSSTIDPLSETSVGPFDEEIILGGRSWTDRIRPTICTTGTGTSLGGADTYQLDIIIDELAVATHQLFGPLENNVGRLLQLYREYHNPIHGPSRHVCDQKLQALYIQLARLASSGGFGDEAQALAKRILAMPVENLVEDGVLGKKTLAALKAFLQAFAGHPLDGYMDGIETLLTLDSALGGTLTGWLRHEVQQHSETHNECFSLVDRGFVTGEGAEGEEPVVKALQAVLNLYMGEQIDVDGEMGATTVNALQRFLNSQLEATSQRADIAGLVEHLEFEVKSYVANHSEGGGMEDMLWTLREMVSVKGLREKAVDKEVADLKEMIRVWHEISDTAPPPLPVRLVLVPRMDGVWWHRRAGMQPEEEFEHRAPLLRITPNPVPLDMAFKCKVLMQWDDRTRYVTETDWFPLLRDLHAPVHASARVHVPREPDAILVQVVQRSGVRGLVCGQAVVTPPFAPSPFEPGAKGRGEQRGRWYPFRSGSTAGAVLVNAFWAQHDPSLPSRAPLAQAQQPPLPKLDTILRMVTAGTFDPNDPANQPVIRRLAERYGGRRATRRRREDTESIKHVLLPRLATGVNRAVLLKRRWELRTSPPPTLTARDRKLVGKEAVPVPLFPNPVEWGLKGEGEVDEEVPIMHEEGMTPEKWVERLRKVKARLKHPRARDEDILNDMVAQPDIERQTNILEQCGAFLVNFCKPITKLRPYRHAISQQPVHYEALKEGTEEAVIQVFVKSASNLPIRNSQQADTKRGGRRRGSAAPEPVPEDADATSGEGSLEPFIEVSFGPWKPKSCKAAPGPDPLFFETLKVTFKADDYRPETLSLIDDPIEITVYDRVRHHYPASDLHSGVDGTTVHYREMRRYLGGCSIPFYTLYHSETATWEGVISLDIPLVSLAYSRKGDVENYPTDHATISVYVALLPGLHASPPPVVFDPTNTEESPQVFWHAQQWADRCRSRLKSMAKGDKMISDRSGTVLALVPATGGRALLAMRFLTAKGIPVPPYLISRPDGYPREAPEFAVAWVGSLIPFTVDLVQTRELSDSWCTTVQYLQKGCGDHEEHAIMLANFFLWLAQPPWNRFSMVMVVVGKSDRYDEAMYVLTKQREIPREEIQAQIQHLQRQLATENLTYHQRTQIEEHIQQIEGIGLGGGLHLWDPVGGWRYSVSDRRCPLHDISVAFSHENVYCNMQPHGQPHKMSWDFSQWNRLFPTPPADIQTVQGPLDTVVSPVPSVREMEIQMYIEEAVTATIRNRRNAASRTMLTRFHRLIDVHGRKVFEHVILPALEEARVEGYRMGRGERDPDLGWLSAKHREVVDLHRAALHDTLSSYHMEGFPLHFAWRDMEDITRAVARTHIHSTDPMAKDVEFAVGVYVKGYMRCNGNDYLSVWVYLATLRRRPERWPALGSGPPP